MKKLGFTTIQVLVLGFVVLILICTFLLMQPFSISGNKTISFVDALFTSTSAVTTTGLIVVDTGSFFSRCGQLIVLFMIQIGGLGYMIFIALLIIGLGKKLSFSGVALWHSSIAKPSAEDVIKFSKKIMIFTLFFEALGAIMLSCYWRKFFSLPEAIYSAIFHSISAFCTAGFGLYSGSLSTYRDSILVNTAINMVCIAGSVGFLVLNDIYHFGKQIVLKKYPRRFSAHSKLAVLTMTLLIVTGVIIMYFAPGNTVASQPSERLLYSIFQIVSATSTAGFSTINIGALANCILWLMILLMYVGSAPGGTGGGIKTTTLGLILLSVRSTLRGHGNEVTVFDRRVPPEMITRAYAIAVITLLWTAGALGVMLITDKGLLFQAILFELSSAFGNVGLSMGITSSLSVIGKIMVSLTMLLGRVGPIAIGYSFISKAQSAALTYPKAEILVG